MANNPYVNKVVFGSATLVDLTGTTATADKILQGYGAFGADGAWMNGTATGGGSVTQDQDGFLVIPPNGSGGGGSSDFSTAEVTFITNLPDQYVQIYGAITDISSQLDYPTSVTTISLLDTEITNGDVYTVVLYNGNTYVFMSADNITVSGNATSEEYMPEYGAWLITITGDCTITIS